MVSFLLTTSSNSVASSRVLCVNENFQLFENCYSSRRQENMFKVYSACYPLVNCSISQIFIHQKYIVEISANFTKKFDFF